MTAPQERLPTPAGMYDANLILKPSGTLTASSSLQATGGAAGTIVDLGAGFVEGTLIFDVTAMTVTAGLGYEFVVTGTESDATLGTDTNIEDLCMSPMIGDVAARRTDANKADDAVGRYIVPFRNEKNGRIFRYIRLYTVLTGSGSITYSARLAPRVGQ
jgi:hypothetical protein